MLFGDRKPESKAEMCVTFDCYYATFAVRGDSFIELHPSAVLNLYREIRTYLDECGTIDPDSDQETGQ